MKKTHGEKKISLELWNGDLLILVDLVNSREKRHVTRII